MLHFDHLLIGLTLLVYGIAFYTDINKRTIPNWLLVTYAILSFLLVIWFTHWYILVTILSLLILCPLIGFTWGKWAYQRIGGGDVKLLMASIISFSAFPLMYTATIVACLMITLPMSYLARHLMKSNEGMPLAPALFIAIVSATILTYASIGYI